MRKVTAIKELKVPDSIVQDLANLQLESAVDMEKHFKPTNTCFNDAMEYLEGVGKADIQFLKTVPHFLCHGILKRGDFQYSHAWVEVGDEVIEAKLYKGWFVYCNFDKVQWHKEMKVVEHTRYSLPQMLVNNLIHKTYGPWLGRYLELTREGQLEKHGLKIGGTKKKVRGASEGGENVPVHTR